MDKLLAFVLLVFACVCVSAQSQICSFCSDHTCSGLCPTPTPCPANWICRIEYNCGASTFDAARGECKCSSGCHATALDLDCPPNWARRTLSTTCAADEAAPECFFGVSATAGPCFTYVPEKCKPGFYGPQCQSACPTYLSSVCNAPHGTCNDGTSGDGTCTCLDGYSGADCSIPPLTCVHGTFAPLPTPHCTCDTGYAGTQCDDCAVDYYHADNVCTYCSAATTCSGHGACRTDGSCACQDGYAGAKCDACDTDYFNYPTCEYCAANTPGVCEHGTCNPLGGCDCDPRFSGAACDTCAAGRFAVPTCDNLCPSYGGLVCAGHGKCDANHVGCYECDVGYVGDKCQYDASYCNGHGQIQPGPSCLCAQGYTGAQCDQCLPGYFGFPTCVACSDVSTCNSHGTCATAAGSGGQCVCFDGFTGAKCDQCTADHYGASCKFCTRADTCSGHGTCGTDGSCVCDAHFTGDHCDQCVQTGTEERYGPSCDLCTCNSCDCNSGISGDGTCVVNPPFSGTQCQNPVLYSPLALSAGLTTGSPAGGYTVTLSGTQFCGLGATPSCTPAPVVLFDADATVCVVSEVSNTRIVCTAGAYHSGVVSVSVKRAGGTQSLPLTLTIDAPSLVSLTPASGVTAGGWRVTLQAVYFPGAASLILVDSAPMTRIGDAFDTPAGNPGQIRSVTIQDQAGVQTNALTFTYAGPIITGLASPLTPALTPITIQGSNFGLPAGTLDVTVNGVACTVSSHNDMQIICTPSASFGVVEATIRVTGGGLTAVYTTSIAAPTVSSVQAASGCTNGATFVKDCPVAGAVALTLTGTNFGASVDVTQQRTVRGQITSMTTHLEVTLTQPSLHSQAPVTLACANLAIASATSLTCTLPAAIGLLSGWVANVRRVDITVPAQPQLLQSNSLVNAVSYVGPQFTDCSLCVGSGCTPASCTGGISVLTGMTSAVAVELHGTHLDSATRVTYGGLDNPFTYECTIGSQSASVVRCTIIGITEAAGQQLHFTAYQGTTLYSAPSNDYLSYAAPTITGGTLALFGGTGSTVLQSTTTKGDKVQFTAANFPLDREYTSVSIKAADGQEYPCTLEDTDSLPTLLVCTVAPGLPDAARAGYTFTIKAGVEGAIQQVTGTDVYKYAIPPVITSVSGCTPLGGKATACPTQGATLTVSGTGFALQTMFKLDYTSVPCKWDNTSFVSGVPTRFFCPLSAGLGTDLTVQAGVVVNGVGEKWSALYVGYSYGAPHLDSVTGCTAVAGDVTKIVECTRDGGVTITLSGSNFGASQATVLVGGIACTNVQHVTGMEHTRVTCSIPAGTSVDLPITLDQKGAPVAISNALKLSYAQCPAGTYVTGQAGAGYCASCAQGYYTATSGQTACLECAAGSYAPNTGATACLACPAGRFSATAHSAACTECSQGYIASMTGQTSCVACAVGSYASGTGLSACTSCAAGTFNNQPNAAACRSCGAGYYAGAAGQSVCAKCDMGMISGVGAASCTACAAGYYEADNACLECAAGSFSATSQQTACTSCAVGTYQALTHQSACVTCAAGTSAGVEGSSTCGDCGVGKYSAAGASHCDSCNAGTFSTGVRSSTCTVCPVGTVQPLAGKTSCDACAVGTYEEHEGEVACESCARGAFANVTGLSFCYACEPGHAATIPGASTCTACTAGHYAEWYGATACSACKAGTAVNRDAAVACDICAAGTFCGAEECTACTPCSIGEFAPYAGASACSVCSAGSYSGGSSATACTGCEAGKFQPRRGQNQCQACPAGSIDTPPIRSSCAFCPKGTISASAGSSDCMPCGEGYYAPDAGMTVCSKCQLGTYSLEGQADCEACKVGMYQSEVNATSCNSCAPGFYAPMARSASCKPCEVGSFSARDGSFRCTVCETGFYQDETGKAQCKSCPLGTFVDTTGATQCISCAAGTYGNVLGMTVCLQCAPGTYASGTGATVCSACAPGTAQTLSGQAACVDCGPGYFAINASTVECLECPRGMFTAGTRAQMCTQCEPGTFAASTASTTCIACGVGQISSSAAAAQCDYCDVGTFSNKTGLSECYSCAKGSYQQAGGQSACLACAEGTYTTIDGAATCDACPAGMFTNVQGRTFCDKCAAGSYNAVPGATVCAQCQIGTYQANVGQMSCLLAVEGTYVPAPGATSYLPCAKGTASNVKGASSCPQCPTGFYTDSDSSLVCMACAAGSSASTPGSTTCAACSAGTYSSTSGQGQCTACASGLYTQFTGRTTCDVCAKGHFATGPGATTCPACDSGLYGPVEGLGVCQACPVGQIPTSATGATACMDCPQGQYSNTSQASTCIDCPAGTKKLNNMGCVPCLEGEYNPQTRQTHCLVCSQGYYSQPGSTDCTRCPRGTYALTAAGACTPCNAGEYSPSEAATQCFACETGKYSSAPGASACMDCWAGSRAPTERSTTCEACGAGEYQNLNRSTNCIKCPMGQAMKSLGATVCLECALGYYADALGMSDCKPCEANRQGMGLGATTCKDCGIGEEQPQPGSAECNDCNPGYYNPVARQACLPCPLGWIADAPGWDNCTQCQPGSYAGAPGSSVCTLCDVGFFQPIAGQSACVQCTTGLYQNEKGATACKTCAAGSYSDFNGKSACTLCSAGSKQPLPGRSACEKCPANTFAPGTGFTTCQSCAPGSVSDGTTSTCTLCPAGTARGPNDLTCMSCGTGTYSREAGSTACTPCAPGTYANGQQITECFQCGLGTNQSLAGQLSCDLCPEQTFATIGAKLCTPCGKNTFAKGRGWWRCTECDPTTYVDISLNMYVVLGYYDPLQGVCCCQAGYYGDVIEPNAERQTCWDYPPGADEHHCAYLNTLSASRGYWRSSNISKAFYACPVGTHCPGGLAADGSTPCSGHHIGPLCGLCEEGYQPSSTGTECVPCPAQENAIAFVALVFMTVAAVVLIFIICLARHDHAMRMIDEDIKRWRPDGVPQLRMFMRFTPREKYETNNTGAQAQFAPYVPTAASQETQSATSTSGHTSQLSLWEEMQALQFRQIVTLENKSQAAASASSASAVTEPAEEETEQPEDETSQVPIALDETNVSIKRDARHARVQSKRLSHKARTTKEGSLARDSILNAPSNRAHRESAAAVAEARRFSGKNEAQVTQIKSVTQKLKIAITFVQLVANLPGALQVPWPQGYLTFISYFQFLTLDLVPWQSLACVVKYDYYTKFLVAIILPVALCTAVFIVSYVMLFIKTWSCSCKCKRGAQDVDTDGASTLESEGKYEKRKEQYLAFAWKMTYFTIFCLYPFVVSVVLSYFACHEVDGVYYMSQDFAVQCLDDRWYRYLPVAITMLLLYPFGIPAYFYYLLSRRVRGGHRFDAIQFLKLGFLFESYNPDAWWAELADMANKLFLTGLIRFFPREVQAGVAVLWLVLFVMWNVINSPYLRKDNQLLAMLSLNEVLMFLLFARVMQHTDGVDLLSPSMDSFLSFVLAAMTVAVVVLFLYTAFRTFVLRRFCGQKKAEEKAEDANADAQYDGAPRLTRLLSQADVAAVQSGDQLATHVSRSTEFRTHEQRKSMKPQDAQKVLEFQRTLAPLPTLNMEEEEMTTPSAPPPPPPPQAMPTTAPAPLPTLLEEAEERAAAAQALTSALNPSA